MLNGQTNQNRLLRVSNNKQVINNQKNTNRGHTEKISVSDGNTGKSYLKQSGEQIFHMKK